ncbi:MAG: chorismate mutase, partial [Alphaproteobacteria bacterium]|nr:chorismate mutase [Alphaproteobacteria bacterium]
MFSLISGASRPTYRVPAAGGTRPPREDRLRIPSMTDPTTSLADLRRRIDAIDDAIHDLLMERAALVDGVRRAKDTADDTPFFRPAREAAILRRLVARHGGPFPKTALVRIWREITAAMVGLQGPFSIAVAVPGEDPGYRDLARDHFGVVAPLAAQRSVRGVIQAVAEGSATVGVVPLPQDGEAEPWWQALDGGG